MNRTLYVSDLDGTLLKDNEKISDFTNHVINALSQKGMLFSYATARSFQTSQKVTKGLNAKIPLIIYNGAIVIDNVSGKILLSNFFEFNEIKELIMDLSFNQVYPIVYSYINHEEKFSFIENLSTKGMKDFLNTRKGDIRENPIENINDLYKGECFYVTCIDTKEKLEPLYRKYKDKYHCVFQQDIYLHSQWLEIMPKKASKSNAIQQLKDYLKCDRLVVFGDGYNDIDMFEMADEAYAVFNAVDELKKKATKIILGNNDDGVAKWLLNNYK